MSEINDNERLARVGDYNGSAFGIHRDESSSCEYKKKEEEKQKKQGKNNVYVNETVKRCHL